ncbi:MAG: SUMF1/EgtB/PvdO family nonheme iron enzyme, partial [Alistipes sp.]|nr:SUMF1/EgtB/PvdO family nonheme iron enzyme [Alistipes sp.]
MKRLLLTIIMIAITLCTAAQSAKNVLEIDQASFRPVQTGALAGVGIDKIGLDRSKRPCARIKMHVNRMTREEIDELVVRPIGGMVELTKKSTAVEGNGLIFELTAKEQVRFYIHHDSYGDSNEVTVNLEANKEYYLDAQLNQFYSILVRSNTPDAEVYIDNSYKGVTNANNELTVAEVYPGEHKLRVKYGGSVQEETIYVNAKEISFGLNVDIAGKLPKFVTFTISPVTAMLRLEGEILLLDEGGAAFKSLPEGTYRYTVEAEDYHPHSGTVVVADKDVLEQVTLQPAFGHLDVVGSTIAGAKLYVDNKSVGSLPLKSPLKLSSGEHSVQIAKAKFKNYSAQVTINDSQVTTIRPDLQANYATVTLTAAEGAEIVINNLKRGVGSWSGELELGSYIVECRKEGYEPSRQSLEVASATPVSLRLDDPKPIYGAISIISTPLLGNVKLDGKDVGKTPRRVDNVLIGKHTVEITMPNYKSWRRDITVAKGETLNLNATLEKVVPTTTTTTTASTNTMASASSTGISTAIKGQPTQGPYKVGDYYNENGKEGVVFWVDASGEHGKIVSLTESKTELQWASVESEQKTLIGTEDYNNGANNMAKVLQIYDWQSKYPAFKWCADLGEGWYLPAIEELKLFTLDNTVRNAINQTLTTKGGTKITDIGTYHYYWSSTERNVKYRKDFCARHVDMYYGNTLNNFKYLDDYVRAVSTFGNKSQAEATTTAAYTDSATANFDGFEMVFVKGGTFTMGATAEQGSDADSDEKPAHSVTVSNFYIGKYEVTQAQWEAVMGKNPSRFKGDNLPVERVSWNDIQKFIEKLNAKTGKRYRLPTEAEWEYAARGGNQSKGYKYSGSNDIGSVAWYTDNSSSPTHPVGQKQPNELGLYDMSGNVYEWCSDWHGSYSSGSQTNP